MFRTSLRILTLKFWIKRKYSCYGALGFSTFFHTTALLIASAYVLNQRNESQTYVIDSGLENSIAKDDGKEIVELEVPILSKDDKDEEDASSKMTSLNVPELQSSSQNLQSLFPTDPSITDEGMAAAANLQSLDKMLADLSGGTGTQARAGKGNGRSNGKNKKKGNGFFGATTEGVRFVFVVDRSASMLTTHFSRWNTRYARLQHEMEKSISNMTEGQQFYIIYFNAFPTYMPGRQLVTASDKNKKKYINWMARIPARGNTDPRQALTTALQLHPDVIYFLTDGEFHPVIKNQLLRMKQNVVKINTYCFGNRASQGVMRSIATKNSGQYLFIR